MWLRLSPGEFSALVLLPLDDSNYLDNKSVTLARKLFDILCLSCSAHYFGLLTSENEKYREYRNVNAT